MRNSKGEAFYKEEEFDAQSQVFDIPWLDGAWIWPH